MASPEVIEYLGTAKRFVQELCSYDDDKDPYCKLAKIVVLPEISNKVVSDQEVLDNLKNAVDSLEALRSVDPNLLDSWLKIISPSSDINDSFSNMLNSFEANIRYKRSDTLERNSKFDEATLEIEKVRSLLEKEDQVNALWLERSLLRLKILMEKVNQGIVMEYKKLWSEVELNMIRYDNSKVLTILTEYATAMTAWNHDQSAKEDLEKYRDLFLFDSEDRIHYICTYGIVTLSGLINSDKFERELEEYTDDIPYPVFRIPLRYKRGSINKNEALDECLKIDSYDYRNPCLKLLEALISSDENKPISSEVKDIVHSILSSSYTYELISSDVKGIVHSIVAAKPVEAIQTLLLTIENNPLLGVLCAIIYNCIKDNKEVIRRLFEYMKQHPLDRSIQELIQQISMLSDRDIGNWDSDQFRGPVLKLFFYIF
jgi:hypothetical protein